VTNSPSLFGLCLNPSIEHLRSSYFPKLLPYESVSGFSSYLDKSA